MEETKRLDRKAHKVTIDERARLTVSAVKDMDSFNENEVIFLTEAGMMTVTGEDLHINRLNLDDGTIIIEGTIESLDYADHEELRMAGKRNLFGRVFK